MELARQDFEPGGKFAYVATKPVWAWLAVPPHPMKFSPELK